MEENCTIIDNEILLIWLTVSMMLILAAIIHIFIRNIVIKPIEEIALDLSLGNSDPFPGFLTRGFSPHLGDPLHLSAIVGPGPPLSGFTLQMAGVCLS